MTNPVSNHDMKVFTGVSNPELSKRLARYCGVTVSDADFCLHNNGEVHLVLLLMSHSTQHLECFSPSEETNCNLLIQN